MTKARIAKLGDPHSGPADTPQSVSIAVTWTVGGCVVAVGAFAYDTTTRGLVFSVAVAVVGGWIGHERSNSMSDSSAYQARLRRHRTGEASNRRPLD